MIQQSHQQTYAVVVLELGIAQPGTLADIADIRHQLRVELFPEQQMLQAVDQITIEKSPGSTLDFTLSRRVEQLEVAVNGRSRKFDFEDGRLQVGLTVAEKNKKI